MRYNLNLSKDEFLGINILNIEEIPECIIAPNILMQKSSLLLEGAAKVGKTDFVFNWMVNMAIGKEFLDMNPIRPLKIFYLHASTVDDEFEQKVQKMGIDKKLIPLVYQNLVTSPPFTKKLNEEAIELLTEQITTNFDHEVDIIVIDSIQDFYDGDINDLNEGNEEPLVKFSENRIEALRQSVNPNAALIVIHENNRIPKEYLNGDTSESKILNKGERYVKL